MSTNLEYRARERHRKRESERQASEAQAWFSYVGKILDDPGFYRFPTVPDFCDGRQSFPTNENSNLVRRGRRRWISLITNPLKKKENKETWRLSRIWDRLLAIIRYIGKSGMVSKKQNLRSSGIFPTYDNQASRATEI